MKGDVGSTQTIPTVNPCARYARARHIVIELFPAPGGPVMPMRRAWPSRGCSAPSNRS